MITQNKALICRSISPDPVYAMHKGFRVKVMALLGKWALVRNLETGTESKVLRSSVRITQAPPPGL
jgi:hypothetical protein